MAVLAFRGVAARQGAADAFELTPGSPHSSFDAAPDSSRANPPTPRRWWDGTGVLTLYDVLQIRHSGILIICRHSDDFSRSSIMELMRVFFAGSERTRSVRTRGRLDRLTQALKNCHGGHAAKP